ncbi:MAG: hypothetical protein R3C60_14620 [Parvularculaceae bacterium]
MAKPSGAGSTGHIIDQDSSSARRHRRSSSLAPLYKGETTSVGSIEKANTVTGMDYIGGTIGCWKNKDFSVTGDCAPQGGALGMAIFAAFFVSVVAAGLGVIGLLPIVGKLTSAITTLAGVVVIAGLGFYLLTNLGSDKHMDAIQWGTYLAGGGGLLTLISGLSGMRGR